MASKTVADAAEAFAVTNTKEVEVDMATDKDAGVIPEDKMPEEKKLAPKRRDSSDTAASTTDEETEDEDPQHGEL